MQFSSTALSTLDDCRMQAESHYGVETGDNTYSFNILTVITALSSLGPLLQLLCAKKVTPPPTPVPTPLAAVGISQTTWDQANTSHSVSSSAYRNGKYTAAVLRQATNKIAAEQKIKRKEARPLAIAALDTARTKQPEELAMTVHSMKLAGYSFGN